MKYVFGILVLCLSSIGVNAQTRRIAHRSHGGSNYEKYDNRDGNYGEIDPRLRVIRRTDTIRFVVGRDSVVRLRDTIIFYYDTASIHQHRKYEPVNDVKDVGRNYTRMTTGM